MIGSNEIIEIQNIIMGLFRRARHYRNHWKMQRYRILHGRFTDLLAAALTLELLEWDFERSVRE